MTEKQGGSDVRANTTRAVPRPDGSYRLTGHKWFTSAPMSDLFLVLAQAPRGLSCFLRAARAARRQPERVPRCSGSRTSSATGPTPPARWSSTGPRLAGGGARPRRADDHRDGQHDPPGLRARLGRHGARRRSPQAIHHARHRRRVRRPAGRPAADAERAGRPRHREPRPPPRWRVAAGRGRRATRGDGVPAAGRRRPPSTGCASARRRVVGEAMEVLGGNGYVEESGMPGSTARRR